MLVLSPFGCPGGMKRHAESVNLRDPCAAVAVVCRVPLDKLTAVIWQNQPRIWDVRSEAGDVAVLVVEEP